MSWNMDDVAVGSQFMVGAGKPIMLGLGPTKIRGAGYVEGPVQIGDATSFPVVQATVMIGPLANEDSPIPFVPGALTACNIINNSPYSLGVLGNAVIADSLEVTQTINAGVTVQAGTLIICRGEVMSRCGSHILSAKKNFDIPHPSKEGWRLRHTCPEAPSNDVYFRGRVTNKYEIELPTYWKDFVDVQSITVNLQPIGAHQDVIIKRIDENKIYLQSKGGMPIDCYYHVYGTRTDGDTLIPEYPGLTPDDYPGDNREYNINT
jgi:hypothetical protein